MIRAFYISLLLLFSFGTTLHGQIHGLQTKGDKIEVDVPFEYINNFIIVDIVFNKLLPLKFIFDTGAEYTILNKREVAEALGLKYEREFKVLGSDMSTFLTAYLIRGNHIAMDGIEAPNADLLVLQEDYFRFEEFAGLEVHGILGANFFKHFVLSIDYKTKLLTFRYPQDGLPRNYLRGFEEVPIHIYKSKVYIDTKIQVNPDTMLQLSLLLDSGAGIASLLHTHSHPDLTLPGRTIEGKIAMGLGGYLTGYLGRIHRLELGPFAFDNVLTSFQDISSAKDTTKLYGRHGIIGNILLSRFKVIIDYPRNKLYLSPIRKFNKGFRFDKSGLGIVAVGKNLRTFEISHIIPGSPADLAGLKRGDIIKKVNFFRSSFLSLSDMIHIFQGREGKKINIRVERNGEKMKFPFRLKTLI